MASTNLAFTDDVIKFHQTDSNVGLEGDIEMPNVAKSQLSTIDEPIKTTICRDLKSVGLKIRHVLLPCRGQELLRDWDLWGPFTIFIILALMLKLSNSHQANEAAPEFAQVFTIFCLGTVAVSVNVKLLGGTLSFFQTTCVLGYCVFPLVISLVLNCLLKLAESTTKWLIVFRLMLVLGGLVYSICASIVFTRNTLSAGRLALAVYPICLFYLFVGWLVFVNTGQL